VSQLQKAKVVELVKKGKNVINFAIGDRTNDVNKIQCQQCTTKVIGI